MTKSVFFETLFVTLAPSVSARASASWRESVSSVPVKTTVFPASGLSAASAQTSPGVTSASSASSAARLRGSAKNSTSSSAMAGPMPWMLPSSSRASLPMMAAAIMRSRSAPMVW